MESNDIPAVQLYQLVMRAVRKSSNIFTVAEKKVMRNLLVRQNTPYEPLRRTFTKGKHKESVDGLVSFFWLLFLFPFFLFLFLV